MNKTIKTVVLWLFVILLSVSFVAYFGLTGESFTPGARVLGTVNGYPIENKRASQFSETLRSLQNFYEAQGLDVSRYGQALVSEAFRTAVINHLVVNQARENQIHVSDEDIIATIKERYFQGDEEEFISFVETGDPTIKRDIEKLIREKLLQEYYEDVFRTEFYSTNQLAQRVKASSRQRKALVALISLAEQAEKSISIQVLEEYYEANKGRYQNTSNQTFEQSFNDVRSDYLLENRDSLIANIQDNISLQFNSIRSNQIIENKFRDIAGKNNMFVVESQAFNFYSRSVLDSQGGRQPLINSPDTIRKLFFLPVGGVSDIITTDDISAVVYILNEEVEENPSSFVTKSYEEALEREVGSSLLTSLYSSLYNSAQVVINDASQTPQEQ